MNKTSNEVCQHPDPRHAEVTRLLRDSLDVSRPKIVLSYQGSIVARRSVTRLVNLAGTRRYKSHAETFNRAVAELSRAGVERSRVREAEQRIAVLLRWLRAAASGLEEPAPEPTPAPTQKRPHAKRRPGFRRIPINTSQLVNLGIELKDTAIVALGCEVQPGELGYLSIPTHSGGFSHKTIAFVYDPDRSCKKWAREQGSNDAMCVRHAPQRCVGIHREGVVILGRVVGFERRGQPSETTLDLRPCNERELADAKDHSLPSEQLVPETFEDATRQVRIAQLRRRLEMLDEEDDQIVTCSDRFKIQKQIYDLEHECADEWEGFDLVVEGGE
jgi:hypothetical protein